MCDWLKPLLSQTSTMTDAFELPPEIEYLPVSLCGTGYASWKVAWMSRRESPDTKSSIFAGRAGRAAMAMTKARATHVC